MEQDKHNNLKRDTKKSTPKSSSIPVRINFITNLLKNNNLEPMINFNENETEYFINTRNVSSDESNDSTNSNDTKKI